MGICEYELLFPEAAADVVVVVVEEETGSAAVGISPYALAPFAAVGAVVTLLEPVRDGNDDREPEGALVGKEFLGGNALVFVAFAEAVVAPEFAGIVFSVFEDA